MSEHRNLPDVVDALLEVAVVPSFSRLGYDVRSRTAHWTPLSGYDLTGRTVVVTGATSGLGQQAAEQFAALGARVVLVGRSAAKLERTIDEIGANTRSQTLYPALVDMGELHEVRALAALLVSEHGRFDVLVHNAGALSGQRLVTSQGFEATVAAQVLGPFLLTTLLLPALSAAPTGRVLTMASGGMYGAELQVEGLQMDASDYRGARQYALAKRAQVTLNELWSEWVDASTTVFHALHPGWADTPGVRASLPTFRRVMGPLLRPASQGVDTLVWLAADDGEPLRSTGGFWHDRRRRSIHRLAKTRRSDTPQRRAELWQWCCTQVAGYVG